MIPNLEIHHASRHPARKMTLDWVAYHVGFMRENGRIRTRAVVGSCHHGRRGLRVAAWLRGGDLTALPA
jgi:hypothetical protein